MFITHKTQKTAEEIRLDFERVIQRFGLVYVGMHNMTEFLMRYGHYIPGEFVVFEFSNPKLLPYAAAKHREVLCLSPGRIAVYRENGITHMSTVGGLAIARNMKIARHERREAYRVSRAYEKTMKSLFRALSVRRKLEKATT